MFRNFPFVFFFKNTGIIDAVRKCTTRKYTCTHETVLLSLISRKLFALFLSKPFLQSDDSSTSEAG